MEFFFFNSGVPVSKPSASQPAFRPESEVGDLSVSRYFGQSGVLLRSSPQDGRAGWFRSLGG